LIVEHWTERKFIGKMDENDRFVRKYLSRKKMKTGLNVSKPHQVTFSISQDPIPSPD
jgi:hypothetical protein